MIASGSQPSRQLSFNVPDFLSACEASSAQAYEALKWILDQFEGKETRKRAREFMTELGVHLGTELRSVNCVEKYHFSIDKLAIDGSDESESTLLLLQLPSIFSPEEWSFTFYEGLARYPITEFQNKTVTELGCGNGWISIALARKCSPARIIGLDINPKAIVCAKINLYLNALNSHGELRYDSDGRTLLDRVEFYTSDLLQYCREKSITLDRVIGCIPQVLSPEPNVAFRIVPENSSDDFLYSLSNYCEKQGYIEDQFGLGLIARAVEEAVELIKSGGKIILNLGGRPGTAVLHRLFQRRGLKIEPIWKTKVFQAGDTDICELVEIEKNSPHRFEFYMGVTSDEPISARTAHVYSEKGGEIAHSLTVYEARIEQPNQIKKILKLLKEKDFEEARSALDLSYEDDQMRDEKISFLASLTEKLGQSHYFPYLDAEGESGFRRRIADFIRNYHRVPITSLNVFVTPSRIAGIKNILSLFKPKAALIDRELAKGLPSEWLSSLASGKMSIIEAPHTTDLVCKLMQKLKPEIAVIGLSEFESRTPDSFARLLEISKQSQCRIFIDISAVLDLSSSPQNNGVFQFLSDNPLPSHAALLCGLVKNRVYSDLDVCFFISENAALMSWLRDTAELTYSRVPALTQEYYDRILSDLLSFQIPRVRKEKSTPLRVPQPEILGEGWIKLSDASLRAFQHPSIQVSSTPVTRETIRLDYGENTFPTPQSIKVKLFESFVRQNISPSEVNPEVEISKHLQERFGIENAPSDCFVLAGGVAPLFASLVERCALEGKTLLFPQGTYGYFVAAAEFFGAKYRFIETKRENAFKLTPRVLHEALEAVGNDGAWLFLNAPVVNPTGAVYSSSEIQELLSVANLHSAKVLLDTIFSGLEFARPLAGWTLDSILGNLPAQKGKYGGLELAIIGGMSKEFSMGGLRFGYGFSRSPNMLAAMREGAPVPPHSTLRYAVKKVYASLNSHSPSLLTDLSEQRSKLKERAEQLTKALKKFQWQPLAPSGGLFMVASPVEFMGKSLTYKKGNENVTVVIDSENISDALFYTTGLLINNSRWTGIPGHCRFVLSVDDLVFNKALDCLKQFASLFP
jgi:methionine S-methyltransferase